MAESRVIMNPPNASSPPPNCAICLGTFTNKCFSDTCMHQFCFKCLLEWSKIKAECPLCKQPFGRIIHNVKSNEEYDEHVVDIAPPDEIHIIDNEEFLFLPVTSTPQPHMRHHFHFRTTFTVDTRGEHAIQQMLLTHPRINEGQITVGGYSPSSSRNVYHRRRRENTSTSFRRSIYIRNLWVNAPPDVTGRYRDVSPEFFRDCPGARTRLVPWLNRELNALLYENTQLVMRLVDIIMDHLLRHHICSRTFRNLLYDYLDNKTDHFIHEFYNFMRSPFDMIGYDRHVIYTERPQSPPPYVVMLQDELSDDNDSDVIIVDNANTEDPVVIDLVDTDSDEPILVSPEEPASPYLPLPERRTEPEPESRAPLLPLKLRLKHKRQSREKEKRIRLKKRSHRRRSRSRSSSRRERSSSSSSSSSVDKDLYKRHKRRKKQKKIMKKRRQSSSSGSDVNVENTSSDYEDDLPLSTFATNKKKMKKFKKLTLESYKDSKRRHQKPAETFTNEHWRREPESMPKLKPERSIASPNLPSCSRYTSTSSSPMINGHGGEEKYKSQTNGLTHHKEEPSSSVNFDTWPKNAYSSPATFSQGCRTLRNASSEDDYPLKQLVKSESSYEQAEQQNSGPSGSKLFKYNERLRNILIKKEETSNTWYSYPCNSVSDSSDD